MTLTKDVGDRHNIEYEARDPDTHAPTAATVALTVTDPAGATTTPSIANPSTGIYRAGFNLATRGLWRWDWDVSGAIVDQAYGYVFAETQAPSTYATLAQLRERINVGTGDRDERLASALSAAARGFDRDTGRNPGGFELATTVSQRHFAVARSVVYDRSSGRYKLMVGEIGSLTGLVVETGGDSTWTAVTNYRVEPRSSPADRQPATALSRLGGWGTDEVRVTALWGWPVTPDDVVEAVLIGAHRLYLRKDTPEGIKSGGEFGAVRLSRMDPDYQRVMQAYSLPGIA